MMLYFRASLIIFIFASSYCSFFDAEFTSRDHFIHRLTKRQATSKKAITCAVPTEAADRTFTIYDLDDTPITKLQAGSRVPKLSYATFQCTEGYSLPDGSNTFTSYCNLKEEWDPPLKKCLRVCPTLQTSNVELTCTDKPQGIISTDCNRPLLTGSLVLPQCMPLHHMGPGFSREYTAIRCRDDGRWDNKLFKCVPDCGIPSHEPLIANGEEAIFGEFPWNVAIYSIPDKHTLICGGTLITTNMVLSAAHCFYDIRRGVPKKDPKDYVIVVGKMTRNYSIIDSAIQKSFQISEILFFEKEYDTAKGYTSDIAIIILKESITVSPYVLPACFGRNSHAGFNPGANATGVLTGWGFDENNKLSKTLKMARLRVINYDNCSKNIAGLANDKFCAEALGNGTSLMRGDSGGGLVFKEGPLYYVRGVLSVKGSDPWSDPLTTSTFTDVSFFQDWIDSVIQERSEHSSRDSITSTTTVRSFTNEAIVETPDATSPSEAPLSTTNSSTTTQLPGTISDHLE